MRFALLLLALGCGPKAPVAVQAEPGPSYPESPREDVVDTYHGVEVSDPYRWLEDMESERTTAWIEAQNTLTNSFLERASKRDFIRERMTALQDFERYGAPRVAGGKVFYRHNTGLQDQSVLEVAESVEAEATVAIDPNRFSVDGTSSLAGWDVSKDGRFLAYGVSESGSDWRTIRVRDLTTGEDLEDEVAWVKFSQPSWHPDGSGFFYSRYPEPEQEGEALHHQASYFHVLGTPQADDILVASAPDQPKWGFASYRSDDDQWLVTEVWEGTGDENRIWVRPIDSDDEPKRILDAYDAEYRPITFDDGAIVVQTDKDAPRSRLIRVSIDDPAPESWTELVPQDEATLRHTARVGDHLVLHYLRDAHSELRICALDGTPERTVELPGLGTVSGLSEHREEPWTFFQFESFTRPPTTYRLDAESGVVDVFRAPKVDFDGSAYLTEQVFYESTDGTRIPMYLTHGADLERTGTAPTLLYGYGGFDIPILPRFKVENLVWLELGGIYASANLRGGGEYGEEWHRAGTRTDKQNVFDDFISAAEYLIDEGYTRPERLGIHGRSNGGLLVGATLTQRPDLFGAALPGVGVLDMMRYHTFTIGWAWADDYGTVDDEAQFRALHAYSPLHNANGALYPPTLITTADHDDRVVPLHSYKFAAALQHAQLARDPVLIRIDTKAGHGAGKSVNMRIEEWTDMLGFLAWALEVE